MYGTVRLLLRDPRVARENQTGHIPVLAIADRDDFWHRGTQWQGQCIDHAAGRESFIQVDLKGGDHATYPYPEARNAVRDFLVRLISLGK